MASFLYTGGAKPFLYGNNSLKGRDKADFEKEVEKNKNKNAKV